MPTTKRRSLHGLFLLPLALTATALGQKANPTKPTRSESDDDVVRVKTELIQNDVTVIDRRGKVVTGLKRDQFVLRVDANPQPVTFFEEVRAGSAEEEKQLKAARSGHALPTDKLDKSEKIPTDRGQLIFFFVDDVHLSGESLARARSLLLNFVENRMTSRDRVAIVSTSGQIGFLQQLTDNKTVLREAVSRLNPRHDPETVASTHVRISETDANMVENHADRGLFNYLVAATMKEYQMQDPASAITMVQSRVRQINQQGRLAELSTFFRLESLIRSTAPLTGRKVIFFVSDGFVVDRKRSSGAEVMQRVVKEAARVGAVLYSLDTRVNYSGWGVDVSRNEYPDMSGGTAWRSLIEEKAPQEPLETLADETGGRSYLNPNALDDAVSQTLAENSAYYLLVWRPDTEKQRAGKSRIEVVIKDRPDLRVRTRRHFFDLKTSAPSKSDESSKNSPDDDLRTALGSLYPRRDLPLSVSAAVGRTDKGTVLNVSMRLDAETLNFESADGKQQAVVDVLGIALDDRGKFSNFKQRLDIPREAASRDRFVKWNQSLPLPPGLYQVRVAVRDQQGARTGSATMWIEIPVTAPK